jgi:DNA repair protein RadC
VTTDRRLASHDRPREKLERAGAAGLGDNELVALVLGSGTRRMNVLSLAEALLLACGGLHGLLRATPADLCRLPGIGAARAAQLLAALELGRRALARPPSERVRLTTPQSVADYLIPAYGGRPIEQFGVILLDARNHVIKTAVVSTGTLDASVVHPRDVFRLATAAGAAGLVLFHNHPSGDPQPSREDESLTRRIVAAGHLMGIPVLDHIVLGDGGYASFKAAGLLPNSL